MDELYYDDMRLGKNSARFHRTRKGMKSMVSKGRSGIGRSPAVTHFEAWIEDIHKFQARLAFLVVLP